MLNIVGYHYIAYGIPLNECIAFDYGVVVAPLMFLFVANQVYSEVARYIVDAKFLTLFGLFFIINNPSTYLIASIGSCCEDKVFATCNGFATSDGCTF